MQVISKAQFKARSLEYFRLVEQTKEPMIITHGGTPTIKISAFQEDPERIMKSLRKSIISYKDPLSPIGEDAWKALQ
jgi:hypothetical protein